MTMTTPFGGSATISEDTRTELVNVLNAVLANSIDLYTQCKHAHWNIKGPHFGSLHRLFDDVAEHVQKASDRIAERAATLGGVASGTARAVAEHSELPEFESDSFSGQDCVKSLLASMTKQDGSLRVAIEACDDFDDPVTENI